MPAQSSVFFAVRDNLELGDKQAHRTVAFFALDDITYLNLQRRHWGYPRLARTLGVSRSFVDLLGNYLTYRRLPVVSSERGIRPYGSTSAQTFLLEKKDHPLDLINLNTRGDRTEQMAALLGQAIYRKIRVDPVAVRDVEKMLGRACGLAWETITSTAQRHWAAHYTTTAMGVEAA